MKKLCADIEQTVLKVYTPPDRDVITKPRKNSVNSVYLFNTVDIRSGQQRGISFDFLRLTRFKRKRFILFLNAITTIDLTLKNKNIAKLSTGFFV